MLHHPDSTTYEQTLVATEQFLRQIGETHWADWLREDINAWQTQRDVSHHRRAYGGMGSFNDVVISDTNEHHVTAEQVPWASCLFEWLRALLFQLSMSPCAIPKADELRKVVGRHNSSWAVFLGGGRPAESSQGLTDTEVKISGFRCLACGYAEITSRDIDTAIANAIVPILLFEACERSTLLDAIKRVLALELPDLEDRRNRLITAAQASNVQIASRETWMRPCPNCRADDSAIYRWTYVDGSPPKLSPTLDNSRLRASASPDQQQHYKLQRWTSAARFFTGIRNWFYRRFDIL
ncbi:hypothetical protein ETAA8_19760 [Anatilimnocola aggregata]|uniref:DUF6966 domain-containing protein n=1 Tax=Anatilimnocola aggregata TaxID=2528021 RepID=A0A517Y9Q6_9BACT|nr:hypothetical protein [Anatilimnocola aggregata]QDU26892.1 hypothetical protein ETAA8_19760 [Anatilimnocola aggregata]